MLPNYDIETQESQEPTRYSRSPKVGNPIAPIHKSNAKGIPALFGLNPVSNFMGFTVYQQAPTPKPSFMSHQTLNRES